jgi:hypothetical protein
MKIIALLEKSITDGGGFNQSLNAILQMKRICENRFEFAVFTTIKKNIPPLEKLGVKADFLSVCFYEKLLSKFVAMPWWQMIQRSLRLRLIISFDSPWC